jgi:hypothetical protein
MTDSSRHGVRWQDRGVVFGFVQGGNVLEKRDDYLRSVPTDVTACDQEAAKNPRFDSLTASSEEVCMIRLFVDKHASATLGCATLVLSSIGIGYSSGAQVESRIRTIDYGTREPIASRLLPEDEVVMIHREFDVAVPRPDATVSDVLKDAVQRSDVVAIVDIHEVSGRLVDDGTWIRTRIVGAVHEIIRSSKAGRFTQKQRLEIDITGGEVRIGKVLVEAEALQLVADRPYLLFLKVETSRAIYG